MDHVTSFHVPKMENSKPSKRFPLVEKLQQKFEYRDCFMPERGVMVFVTLRVLFSKSLRSHYRSKLLVNLQICKF